MRVQPVAPAVLVAPAVKVLEPRALVVLVAPVAQVPQEARALVVQRVALAVMALMAVLVEQEVLVVRAQPRWGETVTAEMVVTQERRGVAAMQVGLAVPMAATVETQETLVWAVPLVLVP